jgi:hypothetical protein
MIGRKQRRVMKLRYRTKDEVLAYVARRRDANRRLALLRAEYFARYGRRPWEEFDEPDASPVESEPLPVEAESAPIRSSSWTGRA